MARVFMQATTVDEFSKALGFVLARPIINKSGIAGLFDFRLESAIDETTQRSARVGSSGRACLGHPSLRRYRNSSG